MSDGQWERTVAHRRLDGELKRAINKYEASKAILLALEKDQRDKEKTLVELNAELRRLRMVENDAVAAQESMVKQTEVSRRMCFGLTKLTQSLSRLIWLLEQLAKRPQQTCLQRRKCVQGLNVHELEVWRSERN